MRGVELRGNPEETHGAAGMDWAALLARLPPSGYRRFRNAFDRVAGTFLLLLLSPLILAIALVILADSGGPIFFQQCRAGRFARPFKIVKFRTMSSRAPDSSLKVAPDNPCITRVGRLLRRSGLDELPNLWNVVKGDMALIGPRPEQFALLDYYYRPWQHARHLLKPGITGWWQINHRDSEPMHLNVEKDIYYVCHQSLALDLRVILGTVMVFVSSIRHQKHSVEVGQSRQASAETELAPAANASGGSHGIR